jgi:hypothetical protein
MTLEIPNQEPIFGYLSTVRSTEHGYFGGYLIISAIGRPLEFHCTAPVRPSRAQEILYGPTLQPYLLGEQIGGTLLAQAKLTPRLILTDEDATLSLRANSAVPLVGLIPSDGRLAVPDASATNSTTAATWDRHFVVAGYEFELPPGFEVDRQPVIELLAQLAARVDLAEPFERIHEAIREAQRIGGRGGQDAHGQAA